FLTALSFYMNPSQMFMLAPHEGTSKSATYRKKERKKGLHLVENPIPPELLQLEVAVPPVDSANERLLRGPHTTSFSA
ncbi:hypothetical protein ACJX0J_019207, partial [Zea mays]